MKKLIPLILSVFFIGATLAFTYDDPLDHLLARLAKVTGDYPQEKLHLQFDKPFYSLGEDVWFKAYLVTAERNTLSSQSKILYIDLVDDRDSVKQTLLLPIINGTAEGDIHLNDSLLSAGNYHIYAYTKWMQNFGSDFFFKKNIPIVNALHGAVTGNLEYKAVSATSGKTLNSTITFKNDNGQPFSNQLVSYNLQANGKNVLNSKGITDAEGKLNITTSLKDGDKDANILINTSLITGQHRTSSQTFAIKTLANSADVQFFPEGGRLVGGIRTKLAFKAVKPDGIGETVTGYLLEDGSNEHIAEFKSEHAGMGVFALLPAINKSYVAVITHEDGSENRYPLPKAETSGYVLNVNHVGKDSLSVKISASPDLISGKEAILIAQCNGVVVFAAKPRLDQATNVSYMTTKKFPTGIIQFTLFTPDYVPVAERLVFIEHNDGLTADIKTDKAEYAKRGKVNLNLKVENAYGEPVIGTFSVAVTDDGKVKADDNGETTILSNLLLTSDIKGYVQQPNYYFNSKNPDKQKHLDQLLLTQGWRRFTWTDLQADKFPIIKYKHEQSLEVTGLVTTLGNKPLSKGKVTLFAKTGNGPLIADTTTDENGHFVFDNLDFVDSTKLIIRASNAKDKNSVKTYIDKKLLLHYPPIYASADLVKGMNLAEYAKYTQERFEELGKFGLMKNVTALKEVTIKDIKARDKFTMAKIIPHSANIDPGSADYVLKPDKLEQETRFADAMRKIPGLNVVETSRGVSVYSIRADNSLMGGKKSMLVIIDGAQLIPEVSGEVLKGLNPQDLAGVEVLTGNGKAIYGNDGNKGILIITTKRGDENNSPANSFNTAHYAPQGYTSTRQFYAPAYDAPDGITMADLRSTIYWNPNVITDADGKASLSYFNADGTGTYKVTLEGMDLKGKLARKVYTYIVK